jgi:CheY-like chemotaxis protein
MAKGFVKNSRQDAKSPPRMEPAQRAFGKRQVGPQNKGAIIIVDDDMQILRLAKRRMGGLTSREILDASTVRDALELITQNEVSLIILDRDLGNNKGAEEILMGILQVCPEKADCVVIHSGDAHRISREVSAFLGEERIFEKGSDSEYNALLKLVTHVEGGGSVKGWTKPFC